MTQYNTAIHWTGIAIIIIMLLVIRQCNPYGYEHYQIDLDTSYMDTTRLLKNKIDGTKNFIDTFTVPDSSRGGLVDFIKSKL